MSPIVNSLRSGEIVVAINFYRNAETLWGMVRCLKCLLSHGYNGSKMGDEQ